MKMKEFLHTPKRILLVKTHAIGDTIMITPAIRALRRQFPQAHIVLLTGRLSQEIMQGNPDIDQILSFDESGIFARHPMAILKLIRRIRREHFDTTFIFQYSSLIHLLVLMFGIPFRIGYDNTGSGFSLTHKVPWEKDGRRWTGDLHLDIARFAGARIEERSLIVEVSQEDTEFVNRFLKQEGAGPDDMLIGIFPGGGKNSRDTVYQKRWSIEKYANIIDVLSVKYQAKIIIFGSRDDRKIASELSGLCRAELINACGRTGLKQLAALIKKCRLFITNDSAPLHIAIAVGTPTISVFGPSRASAVVDKDARHITIQSRYPCSPCYCNSVFPGCKKPRCMDAIGCEEVLAATQVQLNEILTIKGA